MSCENTELYEQYLNEFEAIGGVDKLEELQTHDNVDIYEMALNMITAHFAEDDDCALASCFLLNAFKFDFYRIRKYHRIIRRILWQRMKRRPAWTLRRSRTLIYNSFLFDIVLF
jgi:hypothetical protein